MNELEKRKTKLLIKQCEASIEETEIRKIEFCNEQDKRLKELKDRLKELSGRV